MKIPAWFAIGCGLIVLNLILVLGGSLSRHASAEPPDETAKQDGQQAKSEVPTGTDPAALPPTLIDALPVESLGNNAPINDPIVGLPKMPSLENSDTVQPNIVTLEEVRNAVAELQSPPDLLAPLDAMIKQPAAPVSEQLSHSFFESMKLRLKTVKHLNQSAAGLVDEAAILYQRGEIAEAQKLLGVATQLRETTAKLLVTHQ